MRRCAGCGGFFDGDECPNDHSHIAGYRPPPPDPFVELVGRLVRHQGMVCVIVGEADENGMVGLSYLHERVRASPDDVERIN